MYFCNAGSLYGIPGHLPKHLRVTDRGMQLVPGQSPFTTHESEHILDRIYLFQAGILEKTEASDAKHRVEDVDHIARPVCETAQLWILPT
jgi:hypothetical protein